jgi:hypothetical protein
MSVDAVLASALEAGLAQGDATPREARGAAAATAAALRPSRSGACGTIGVGCVGIGGGSEQTYVKADKEVYLLLGNHLKHIEGLSVLFQVNNLTDTAFRSYAGTEDRPRGYSKYGRQMLLGLNYKL